MNRQPHDPGAKAKARQVYEAHGARRATELTGVPRRTITAWARVEGWQRKLATAQAADQHVAPVADAQPPPAKTAPVGRPRLAMRIREELWAQLDAVKAYREAKRPRDAKDAAVVAGIFLDKLLVLEKSGDATGTVDPVASRARIHELLDGIEQRRTAGRG